MKPTEQLHHVSDTAIWMAYYRALETEKENAIFCDPWAKMLTKERGPEVAAKMKSAERFAYWSLVTRTHLIDRLVMGLVAQGYQTVINLGAGLDTRPYRLVLPKQLNWIEIDFPAVIELKSSQLAGEKPVCALKRIPLDLTDDHARQRIFSQLNECGGPAVLLMEGVIPYLTEEMVRDLARDLHRVKPVRLWIADYYSEKLYPRFQENWFQNRLGSSPFQFFPRDWFGLFSECSWQKKELHYLFDEGETIRRPFPLPWWLRPLKTLVGSKRFGEELRLQGFSVLEKAE